MQDIEKWKAGAFVYVMLLVSTAAGGLVAALFAGLVVLVSDWVMGINIDQHLVELTIFLTVIFAPWFADDIVVKRYQD